MAIADIQGGASGAPFVKFAAPGDTLIGAYGGGKSRQQRDFTTQQPKFKAKDPTKPALEFVAHLVAMPGTTAFTGTPEDPQPIVEGTHVRYPFSGFKWGQLIEATKQLPAYSGFGPGVACSGDIITVTMTGWSSETDNPAAAVKAGLTVRDNRIVMSTAEQHETWVLSRVRAGLNTNAAKDFTITVRRPTPAEKRWEQAGDELFTSKPWDAKAAADADHSDDGEPF